MTSEIANAQNSDDRIIQINGNVFHYCHTLWRNSLPLSVNLSHISSSLLLLSSHPAPAPLIRYTILALYKFICMYVCIFTIKNKLFIVCVRT